MKIELTKKQIATIAYQQTYKKAYAKGIKNGKKDGTPLMTFITPSHNEFHKTGDPTINFYNGFDEAVEVLIRRLPRV